MGPVPMSTRPHFTGQRGGRNGKFEESVEFLLTRHKPAKLPVKGDIKPPGQSNSKQGSAVQFTDVNFSAVQ